MGDRTQIEWTDATWNPVRGCSRVSEGCRHCYAEAIAARFSGPGQAYEGLARRTGSGEPRWTGKIRTLPEKLDEPLRWRKPRRIFVNSMSDLFHPDVPVDFIDRVFAVMALAPQHIFQVLTKRPARMLEYLTTSDLTFPGAERRDDIAYAAFEMNTVGPDGELRFINEQCFIQPDRWPLPNVWVGVSIEDQATADERVPLLLRTPSAVRFLSCEPLLGPIDLRDHFTLAVFGRQGAAAMLLHWIIVGGETGPRARPMYPGWARSIRDQCLCAGIPFFFKQWGGRTPKSGGRLLGDREWNEMPKKFATVIPGGT